jgi:hypothetical protein
MASQTIIILTHMVMEIIPHLVRCFEVLSNNTKVSNEAINSDCLACENCLLSLMDSGPTIPSVTMALLGKHIRRRFSKLKEWYTRHQGHE